MLRLEKIEIIGFKDSDRKQSITFSKEAISVIYGDNGCGKTTMLNIIHAILSKNEQILRNERVSKIIVDYSINGNDKKVIINQSSDMSYNWDKFDHSELKISNSILFGVHRGITYRYETVDFDTILNFLYRGPFVKQLRKSNIDLEHFAEEFTRYQNFSRRRKRIDRGRTIDIEKEHLSIDDVDINSIESLIAERYRQIKRVTASQIQKALSSTMYSLISKGDRSNITEVSLPEDFHKRLIDNKDRLLEVLESDSFDNLATMIIQILTNINMNDLSELEDNKILSSLLLKIMNELAREKILLDSIDNLTYVFNEHIKPKELIIDKDGIRVLVPNEKNEMRHHTLNDLSSGEKNLLTFLSLFIIEGSKRNFLMIDEPEISLNMKWQRELLPLLNRVASNTQIIVASHSPFVARKNNSYLVELK